MQSLVYESIDDIGIDRIEALDGGLDFSFGLLRAIEKTLWGELLVRYVTVESGDGGKVLIRIALFPKALSSMIHCSQMDCRRSLTILKLNI